MSKSKNAVIVISEKEVASMIATVKKAQAAIGEVGVLSTATRKSTSKPPATAAKVISTVATVAAQRKVEVPGRPVAEMAPRMLQAERLRQVLAAVAVFQQALKDAILVSEGEAWDTAMATYAVLRRMARRQPDVAAEIAPATAVFKRPKSKAAVPAEPPKT